MANTCVPEARLRIDSPLVGTIIGRLTAHPPTAGASPRLLDILADNEATIEEIAGVIMTDGALSARLLQVVNSAFFGLPFKVSSLPQAVSYLGLTSLRALALLTTVFAAADACPAVAGFSPARLQRHSLLCARLARALVQDRRSRDDAFTGGLLHDLGMPALAVGLNQPYSLALRQAERSGQPIVEVETSLLGTSHAAVGAGLASAWGLPAVVIEAIEQHHAPGHSRPAGIRRTAPGQVGTGQVGVVAAVRLAQAAAERLEKGDRQFDGVGLTRAQIDLIDEEFSLTEIRPARRQPLLAI